MSTLITLYMNLVEVYDEVLHESIQKGMEAELSSYRERELLERYKKRSLVMMRELHAKEMQIEKIQSMKIESQSGMFIYVSELYYFIYEFSGS